MRWWRIYGHYPVIDGSKTTFYRHPIHNFAFTALEGKEKWTAYKLTKNVYDVLDADPPQTHLLSY
jgi:hypothetical protein